MPALWRTTNGQHSTNNRSLLKRVVICRRWRRGFTLIELLVVITIIAILVTISVAAFGTANVKGRDAKRKADLDAIKKALELYKIDKNGYYPNCPGGASNCTITTAINFDPSTPITPDYIKSIPQDPKNTGSSCKSSGAQNGLVYCYLPSPANCSDTSDCTGYRLAVCLENNNEPIGNYVQTYLNRCSETTATAKWYRFDNP